MIPDAHVTLREVSESDLEQFFEHQKDPIAAQMADFPTREREAFFTHWHKIMADSTNVLRTILFDSQVAGNVVSFVMNSEREVGYWVGREYWGKGIATDALKLFLVELNERPLFGHVARHNLASAKVLQKCGFTIDNSRKSVPGKDLTHPDDLVFILMDLDPFRLQP